MTLSETPPPGESHRRVLLAGASGYVGRAVARALVERGMAVVALVRQPGTDLAGCETVIAQVTDQASLSQALGNTRVDAVVSCIASRSGVGDDAWLVDYQANRNLLNIAGDTGAARFMLLSAICVQRPRLAFQHAKLAFEAELARSTLDFTVVRPTAFFKSLSGQVERVNAGKPFVVFGEGTETACKPISAMDLATFMVDCLENPACRNRILPIGGPGDALTPLQQGQLLFELTGRPPRFRHVPVTVFNAAIAVLAPLGTLVPAAAAKAELARIGRYYATESMLVWDEANGAYSAAATPETGRETLRDHYARVLIEGLSGQELGAQKLF
jgi:divinyl chlorophyllide a 8-vinyl-reductase